MAVHHNTQTTSFAISMHENFNILSICLAKLVIYCQVPLHTAASTYMLPPGNMSFTRRAIPEITLRAIS